MKESYKDSKAKFIGNKSCQVCHPRGSGVLHLKSQACFNDNDLSDKPQLIYNLDETGIQPEHRPPNILAPKNGKHATLGTTMSFKSGNYLPPYFVYKGKRFNTDLTKGRTPGAGFTMSESVGRTSEYYSVCPPRAHLTRAPAPGCGYLWSIQSHYNSKCASFMRDNKGQVVTRYQLTELACRAYLCAMSPVNLVSAFRKAGIFPFTQFAVDIDKLYPSEIYKDSTPLQKVASLKAGKESLDRYLLPKVETAAQKIRAHVISRNNHSQTHKKPEAGVYEENKENKQPKAKPEKKAAAKKKGKKHKPALRKALTFSPKPSTSGLGRMRVTGSPLYDNEESVSESDVCCVCKHFSPLNLNSKPYLKIMGFL
ncbi:hypothetical protein MAR_015754 [Mya arenaria]|uniref:Uncharacterized protein n=1 Tax=Mya arenaria TaxID=6604 RepID=A0ABY7FI61_MYAAR|nr:hypothetical protein MAR_015754 [Mya arenaria]